MKMKLRRDLGGLMRRAPLNRGDVVALGVPFVAAAAGGIVTAPAIPSWYRALRKPSWNPPDRVFGPVWTALYLSMGVGLLIARRAARDGTADGRGDRDLRTAQTVFGLQLALNLAWSLAFFRGRNPKAGLAVIVGLWLAIAATIAYLGRIRPLAGVLLVPYLAWVSFASLLNLEIVRRNPDA